MGLRPGHCYRNLGLRHDRAYTRVAITVPRKNFIGATPGLRTRQFNMGNPTKKYTHLVNLIMEESCQIRDNAIESARLIINRFMIKRIGKDDYFMRIRLYPHQILRENKQAQGAHADRIQKGMSHPFGRPIGRAIRVHAGGVLLSVLVNKDHIELAKEGLLRAKARMPCTVHVKVSADIESIGTLPRRAIEEKVVQEVKETAESVAAAGAEGAAPGAAGAEAGKGGAAAAPAAGGKEAGKPAGKGDEKKGKK